MIVWWRDHEDRVMKLGSGCQWISRETSRATVTPRLSQALYNASVVQYHLRTKS